MFFRLFLYCAIGTIIFISCSTNPNTEDTISPLSIPENQKNIETASNQHITTSNVPASIDSNLTTPIEMPSSDFPTLTKEEKIISPEIKIFHFGAWEANILSGNVSQPAESKFPQFVALKQKLSEGNSIICASGDIFSGEETNDLPVLEAMDIFGLQVMALSNLELNYTKKIKEKLSKAKFITLSANVYEGENRLFQPYIIKEISGIKIGIIGLTTEEAAIQVAPEKLKGLMFRDPIKEVQKCLDELKGKAEIIIVISNMRHPRDLELAQACPNITAILGRYDLDADNLYTKVGKVVISRIHHKQGQELAGITLQKQENSWIVKEPKIYFLGSETELKKKNSNISIVYVPELKLTSDSIALNLVEKWHSQRKELSEVLCQNEEILEGEYQIVRQQETNLGNLISDILLESRPGADIAVVNSGCIRASIKTGPVTRGMLQTTLPYNNKILEVEITGETIKEMLENSVAQYEKVSGAFLQIANMNFTFNPNAEKFNRVEEIKIQGEPLELEKVYRLVTLEYLIQGGDDYIMLKDSKILFQFDEPMQKIIENYLKKYRTVKISCEGRIVKK